MYVQLSSKSAADKNWNKMSTPDTNPEDLKSLKERMKLIADADPTQYHNEFSLKRFLRAFKTVDAAFQVNFLVL